MDPVIIVGAGPVGLALALALARYGVRVVVLDDQPPKAGVSAATAVGPPADRLARTAVLRPRTAAFLARLGCGDALDEGVRWTGWRVLRGGRTRERVELPADAPAAPLHLAQSALTRSLRALLDAEKDAEVVPGSRLDTLEQEPHGVNVRTRAGIWRRGGHLVGCDGARSTVRKLLDVPFTGRSAVERHAVAAVRAELPWSGEAVLDRGPAGRPVLGPEVTARPLPGARWRLDWLLPERGPLVTPEELVRRVETTLAAWGADPDAYELLDTGVHTVHHRLARRWRTGRVLLAGDAAHLLGSLGAQQLDEGLADAENLAWKLAADWHQGGSSKTLLGSYEAERRDAVSRRLRATDQALPLLRRTAGGWRAVARGGTAAALLTDGHLGRGIIGAAAAHAATPLAPDPLPAGAIRVGTPPGSYVEDVAVTAPDGWSGTLHARLGQDPLVVLVAPGTRVWERSRWLRAGLMPDLTRAVAELPVPCTLLIAEEYPEAPAHTLLYVRPDGHLVAALAGVRAEALRACADAARGAAGDPVEA